MGYINLSSEPDLSKQIKQRVSSRGLILEPNSECEIHGPHHDMAYSVYIVTARRKDDLKKVTVALYPNKIYQIGIPSDWWKCESDSVLKVVR